MADFEAFNGHQYLNIETFRKDGRGVKTPVWFARQNDALYVWTQLDSGKTKRIRRNDTVNIAPCQVSGETLGEWVPAQAKADASPEALVQTTKLMRQKYGLSFAIFKFMGKLRKAQNTALIINPP
jgi:PPOX class probable F420-dependent enzyme